MHRLFVAIRPPDTIRDHLIGLMSGIEHARWQDDGQLHITLAFIGEVDRHCAQDVAAALGHVSHPRFDIRLDGIGTFDRRGRISAIWAGLRPHDQLKSLHKAVKGALRQANVEPETRALLPHITLARTNSATGPIDNFAALNSGLTSPPFPIDTFHLIESHLGHGGSRYEIAESYPLLPR